MSFRWSMVGQSLTRPYRVSISMVLLVLLVPFYIFIPELLPGGRTLYVPELAWDRVVPLVFYPTVAPRPPKVIGEGFAAWGLRSLYGADPPFNCFPSLHVAHSFVSALTCYRVHRGVGIAATICASLVGVSTLLTKQHYILDVIAGTCLAYVAYVAFLRNFPREEVPEMDRRLAPVLAMCIIGICGLAVACFWVVYRFSGES